MDKEIQNLINEKTALNNRIKLRRQRHNEEIETLKQEYFSPRYNGDKYKSTNILNQEIEEENKKFEDNLKQEFEQKIQEKNNRLKDEKEKLEKILSAKTKEYSGLMREVRNDYIQGSIVMPNMDKLRKEIEEIQQDIKTINASLDMNEISIAEQTQPEKGEPVKGEPVNGEPIKGEPVKGEPVNGEPINGEPVKGESVNGEPINGELVKGEPIKGQPTNGGHKDKLKIKIGTVITTKVNGKEESKGITNYNKNETDIEVLEGMLAEKGFQEQEIKDICRDAKELKGDMNVLKTLLASSQNKENAGNYIDDYIDVLKGKKEKLTTFDLEYDLRNKSYFSKSEWKNMLKQAADSRNFANIKGGKFKLLMLIITDSKVGKAIFKPFKKAYQLISSRKDNEPKMLPKASEKTLANKFVIGKVKVDEGKAIQNAKDKAEGKETDKDIEQE